MKLIILILVIGVILVIGLIIGVSWKGASEAPSLSPAEAEVWDSHIRFQLEGRLWQLWRMTDQSKSYDEFNSTNDIIKSISDSIVMHGGKLIIRKASSSASEFCAYSRLNTRAEGLISWYCIDSNGGKCLLTIDPSAACNKDSYTCPCSF